MADRVAVALALLQLVVLLEPGDDAGGGLVHSQRVLLALTGAGMSRDEAYRVVQRHALTASDGGTPFREALAADPAVTARLNAEQLAECFDPAHHLRSVETLFARAEEPR